MDRKYFVLSLFVGRASMKIFCKHAFVLLTHWGRATHVCVSKFTIIASDNGVSPGRRQAIIWNNAGILSIGLFGTKFREILVEILTFSFRKMRLKVSSTKWRRFCRGLNVLIRTANQSRMSAKHPRILHSPYQPGTHFQSIPHWNKDTVLL